MKGKVEKISQKIELEDKDIEQRRENVSFWETWQLNNGDQERDNKETQVGKLKKKKNQEDVLAPKEVSFHWLREPI